MHRQWVSGGGSAQREAKGRKNSKGKAAVKQLVQTGGMGLSLCVVRILWPLLCVAPTHALQALAAVTALGAVGLLCHVVHNDLAARGPDLADLVATGVVAVTPTVDDTLVSPSHSAPRERSRKQQEEGMVVGEEGGLPCPSSNTVSLFAKSPGAWHAGWHWQLA